MKKLENLATMGNFHTFQNWLGIPLDEQPPSYDRLLDLALFESNPNVPRGNSKILIVVGACMAANAAP